jgi:hypothetical protein
MWNNIMMTAVDGFSPPHHQVAIATKHFDSYNGNTRDIWDDEQLEDCYPPTIPACLGQEEDYSIYDIWQNQA